MKVLIISLSLLVLLLLWQFFRQYPERLPTARIKKLSPVLGPVALIAFIALMARYWFRNSPYLNLGMLLAILLIGLPFTVYFGREFIRGLQLKLAGMLVVGKEVKTLTSELRVLKMGIFKVEVVDDDGRRYSVPYSALLPLPKDAPGKEPSETFEMVSIAKEIAFSDEKKLIKTVNQLILICPWVKPGQLPKVELTSLGNNTFLVNIAASPLSGKYHERLKHYLNEQILSLSQTPTTQ